MATFLDARNSTFNHAGRDLHIYNNYNFRETLRGLNPAPMDETRSECLVGTRKDIVDLIIRWVGSKAGRIFWLYGVAGSGKSTLSATIANLCRSQKYLGAFLFFNRDISERNQPKYVIRTLAYQLGLFDARIGTAIASVIHAIPTITQLSFRDQFHKLLVEPLSALSWSSGLILLVLDALDECGSARDRRDLLAVLAGESVHLPPFIRIIITSRNEPEIRKAFTAQPHILSHELDITSSSNFEDIKLFLRHRMQTIYLLNDWLEVLPHWPDDADLLILAERANGLFEWAATACRLIEESHDPRERLDSLLGGSMNADAQSALDALFADALQIAGVWNDDAFCSDFRAIMGIILVARDPITLEVIDSLLYLRRPSVHLISKLGSVIRWSRTDPVRVLHPSFADYLTDRLRCGSETRYIDVGFHHRSLAIHCIDHLDGVLKQNIYNLTLSQPLGNQRLPQTMAYAAASWIDHVCMITDGVDSIVVTLESFIIRHLLHWLEAMSILKKSRSTVELFRRLQDYLSPYLSLGSLLSELISDTIRFSQSFACSIEEHPLFIYESALPFAPVDTVLFQKFCRPDLPRVIGGYNTSWPQVLHVLDHGHDARVLDVAFSHDGERLVSASSDGSIRIWDATSFEPALPPLVGHSGSVCSIAISGDGRWVASGGDDCTIRLWDASKGSEVLPPIVGHKSGIQSLAFSPDVTRIVSGSLSGTVRVWNAISGSQIAILLGHANAITSVSFSQDGTRIISCSYNDSIRLWDATSGVSVQAPLKCKNTSATISPNGEWVVCCWDTNVGSELRIWNSVTGVEDRIIPLSEAGLCDVSFFPDGRHIAGASNRHVHTWDIITGHHISSIEVPQLSGCMALSPNGDRVAVGLLRNCTIGVWNTEQNFVLHDATTPNITKSSSLPDCQHASSSSSSQKQSTPAMEGHTDYISCIIFSPDGSFIASGSHDNTICVWDAATGAQMLTLRGHEDIICCVAFSEDGTQIVSGSSDGIVCLWNASSGALLLPPLRGHKKYLVSVAFSPGGKRIVSACWGHKICIWDTITGAKIHRLRMPQESIDLVRYLNDKLLYVIHHNRSKRTRTSSIWSISDGCTVAHQTSCLCGKIIMAHTVVHENGSIVDLITAKIIGKFPSIVSVKKYAVSNTSIAFTSDDRWSTMFILHFPHTIISIPEMPTNSVSKGNIDDGDVNQASDDGSGNEECGYQMSDNCKLIEYDSSEDSEEDESDDDESGDSDNDRGPRIVRIKPGKHICIGCRERC